MDPVTNVRCDLCGALLYLPGEVGRGVCDPCFQDEQAWYNMGEDISCYDCSVDDPDFDEEEVDCILA